MNSKAIQAGILAGVTGLLLASCQVPLATQPTAAPLRAQAASRQVLRADVRAFPQPVPVEVEPNRLIFTTPQDLHPNQVLMGRSTKEVDFLRRIVRLQTQGNRLIADTAPATLFDAFSELDLAGASTVRAPEFIQLRSQHFNIGGVLDLVLDLGVKPDFSDTELRVKDSRLYVKVAPSFTLDTRVRAEYTFLKTAAPAALGTEPPQQPVGDLNFNALRVPAWIGPVPLVFHLNPGTRLSYGHYANGKLIGTTQVNGVFKASVALEAGVGETPVTHSDSSYQLDGQMLAPELQLTGVARARLHLPTLHLDTEIAGLVGPFIEASPYVDGRYQKTLTATPAQTTVRTSVLARLGLAIDGGVTPTTLFGKQLAREIRIKILDKTLKELYRKDSTDVVPN